MTGKTPVKARRALSTPRKGTSSIAKTLHDAEVVESPSLLYPPITPTTNRDLGERTSSSISRGKRKADEVEPEQGTPPDRKKEGQRATFAEEARPLRPSSYSASSSHAPSSYQSRKRAKLNSSAPISEQASEQPSRASSRASTRENNTGSWSQRAGAPFRTPSRAASNRSNDPNDTINSKRKSMSGVSIPISALISPHAPSVSRSSTFHMRDPRKPPKKRARTGWVLQFADPEEPGSGSPVHAWLFFAGFVLPLLWWFAAVWKIPETRQVGGTDVEKAVDVDDPQVEHDARSWRFRCRIVSLISLFTYIPFIVLVAVFAPH